jgi:phosphosulfolactate phosphohydrolase-like enzyme
VRGELALDDAYCAGRIAQQLAGEPQDSARAAILLARSFPSAVEGLGAGRSAANLLRHGLEADVERCAQENVLDVVPRYVRRVGPAAEVTL